MLSWARLTSKPQLLSLRPVTIPIKARRDRCAGNKKRIRTSGLSPYDTTDMLQSVSIIPMFWFSNSPNNPVFRYEPELGFKPAIDSFHMYFGISSIEMHLNHMKMVICASKGD
jgi:hypothetical protein